MLSTTSTGSGLATPGSAATAASVSAGIDRHLPTIAEDPLRSEHHQHHQPEPDERQADRTDRGAGDGEPEVAEDAVGQLQQEPVDDGPEDRAEHPSRPAEDHDDVEGEGDWRDPGRRVHALSI